MSEIKLQNEDKNIVEMAMNSYQVKEGENSDSEFFKGVDNESENIKDPESSFMKEELLSYTHELFEFGAVEFDDWAKGKGLPGLGKIDPKRYANVGFIYAKKSIPDEWLEHSPDLAFYLMTTKILLHNGIELRKLKNQQNKGENE